MRYVRFRDPAGAVRHGVWTGKTNPIRFGGDSYSTNEVDVLPPCSPSKLVCVGLNYADHAAELDAAIPDRPRLFFKPPSAVAAHDSTITLPDTDARIDFEAELAVVIDRQCRNVREAEAMDVVKGYTCLNDLSNRDEQNRERNYVRTKGFDGAAPLGPVLATPEEVPDDAFVRTRVNGSRRQDGTLSDFLFTVPELITEITRHVTLEAGDVVSTGTPKGVGPLEDGNRVEIDIEGVGILKHAVRAPS